MQVDPVNRIRQVALQPGDGHRRSQRWFGQSVERLNAGKQFPEQVVRTGGVEDMPGPALQHSLCRFSFAAAAIPVQRVPP
ncbi:MULTISPECIES: hypothetical protein [Amycolatopsis]|uniref:hypothetical protein n=1 Tax=Amycolatopsis TaxID=1813 RepID=UPI001E5A2B24|nr:MULTISPECIES: hypothetical protein [Amycolatopsis]